MNGRILLVISVFVSSMVAQARDNGQYAQVPLDVRTWIERLADNHGISCCATADGYKPDDVEWDIGENHYRVKIDGHWLAVPSDAVIKARNRLGYALVWYHYELDGIAIRCFLPGDGT